MTSRHRHQHDPHRLLESPLFTTLVMSMFKSALVVVLGRVPDADDHRVRLNYGVSGPALRLSRFSSEILTRDGKRHWPSSVCLSLLDPWSHAVQIDSFVGRSQSCGSVQIALPQAFNPPPACFAVSLLSRLASSQISGIQGNLPKVRSAKVRPRYFSPRVSPFRLEFRMHCHCHPETMEQLVFQVFCPRPISPTR